MTKDKKLKEAVERHLAEQERVRNMMANSPKKLDKKIERILNFIERRDENFDRKLNGL